MWHLAKRLSLCVSLIFLAAMILLLSDPPKQKTRVPGSSSTSDAARPVKIAMFQMASQPIIDEGAAGVFDSLKDAGFSEGVTFKITRFNAEGDTATANAIAQELVGGGYDLIITLTTSALQATANANKQGLVKHVFGLVSDPIKAGVGIGTDPLDHPSHLVGIGTFPPVSDALKLARQVSPELKRVGLAWNPAEVNSEVCTLEARKTCKGLGLDLLEANVENTAAVKEAVASLIDRQVDALLVGSDVTMLGAIDVVVKAGNDAGIPVFTCIPGNAKKGTLFDIGANYYEVGRTIGRVAARVLEGESIANIPVEMAIPPKLFLNKLAAKNLKGNWSFSADVLKEADSLIDETGQHDKAPPKKHDGTSARTPNPEHRSFKQEAGDVWKLKKIWKPGIFSHVNFFDAEDADLQAADARGDTPHRKGIAESTVPDLGLLASGVIRRKSRLMSLYNRCERANGKPTVRLRTLLLVCS